MVQKAFDMFLSLCQEFYFQYMIKVLKNFV